MCLQSLKNFTLKKTAPAWSYKHRKNVEELQSGKIFGPAVALPFIMLQLHSATAANFQSVPDHFEILCIK